MADVEENMEAAEEAATPANAGEVRVVNEQVVRIENPLKNAASSARGRWTDFLDTSYDGSIVWAARRGAQWVVAFFKSLRGLAGNGRG